MAHANTDLRSLKIASVAGVLDVHDIRAEYIGPDVVHAGMHVTVKPELTVREADRIADEVTRRIHAAGDTGYCLIHVEPAETVAPSPAVREVVPAH